MTGVKLKAGDPIELKCLDCGAMHSWTVRNVVGGGRVLMWRRRDHGQCQNWNQLAVVEPHKGKTV